MAADGWMAQIVTQYQNKGWLGEYLPLLYSQISQMITRGESLPAIEYLLKVFPYLLDNPDLKRWGLLLNDLVQNYYPQAADSLDKEATHYVGDWFVLTRQKKIVLPTVSGRRQRRRFTLDRREIFESYLVLLMGQMHQRPETITIQTVEGVQRFARTVNNPSLYRKAYTVIALILYRLSRFRPALDFSRLSYRYWSRLAAQDRIAGMESGISAFGMALAYNGQRDLQTALRWLGIACDHLREVRCHRPQIHIEYVRAFLEAQQGNLERAAQRVLDSMTLLDHVSDEQWRQHSQRKLKRMLSLIQSQVELDGVPAPYPLV